MDRYEAISKIAYFLFQKLDSLERYDRLLNWWSIDSDDVEYHKLPKSLQTLLDNTDEPPIDVSDSIFDSLLIESLKADFIGVTNEYLSALISDYFGDYPLVTGILEDLFRCPCCEFKTLGERGQFFVCPVCRWEDVGEIEDLEKHISCNNMSLSEAKADFLSSYSTNEMTKRYKKT